MSVDITTYRTPHHTQCVIAAPFLQQQQPTSSINTKNQLRLDSSQPHLNHTSPTPHPHTFTLTIDYTCSFIFAPIFNPFTIHTHAHTSIQHTPLFQTSPTITSITTFWRAICKTRIHNHAKSVIICRTRRPNTHFSSSNHH